MSSCSDDNKVIKETNNNVSDLIKKTLSLFDEDDYIGVINLLEGYDDYNNSELYFLLGFAYLNMNIEGKALTYLSKADKLGNFKATGLLGNIFYSKEEYDISFKLLKIAADHDIAMSYVNLGQSYSNGLGVEVNPKLAFLYFKKAAEEGISEGYFNLASCYDEGSGTPQNLDKAIEYYLKAAELDNIDAFFNLGVLYYENKNEYHNLNNAFKYFTKYLDYCEDDYTAYNYLGLVCYENNEFNKGVNYFKKAVSLGDNQAAFNLGIIYLKKNNKIEAQKWFRRAAELGNNEAYKYL